MADRKVLGIEQARAQLPSIVAQAHAGKVSVVTRHGQPYAAIVPVHMLPTQRRSGLLALRGSGKGLWDQSAPDEVRKLREEWG